MHKAPTICYEKKQKKTNTVFVLIIAPTPIGDHLLLVWILLIK